MSLITEIHKQSRPVRMALFFLSTFVTLSVVGFIAFSSAERDLFMALERRPGEEAAFLARRESRSPKPLAAIGRGLGSLTATIGGALGLDRGAGFDQPVTSDKVYLLPLSD